MNQKIKKAIQQDLYVEKFPASIELKLNPTTNYVDMENGKYEKVVIGYVYMLSNILSKDDFWFNSTANALDTVIKLNYLHYSSKESKKEDKDHYRMYMTLSQYKALTEKQHENKQEYKGSEMFSIIYTVNSEQELEETIEFIENCFKQHTNKNILING